MWMSRMVLVVLVITASGCRSTSRHSVTQLTVEATPQLDGRIEPTARLTIQVESFSR